MNNYKFSLSGQWRLIALILFTSFFGSAKLLAQETGEVRGTVYDKEKGEPLAYTPVGVKGTTRGSVSDLNGYYSIGKLAPGSYMLHCTALGYDTADVEIIVRGGQVITQNIYLSPSSIKLQEVRITKDKSLKESRVEASKVEISPTQIQVMPSVGAEPDLAQYLQLLPGIVFTGDQGGQLYVRGGAPIQNKVLLDGMTIYNPFHSIGLFSVFDVDIIRNVDVYTGGFNAQYGGRLSSIMDITTRDGDRTNFGGKISVSPFTAKVMLEGPLQKFSEKKPGSSFLFSARSSYLRQTAPIFYPYAGDNGLPYNFTDLYGKVSFNGMGGSKASFFGFNFNDNVKFSDQSYFKWNSYGMGTKLTVLPASSTTVIDINFDYSDYKAEQKYPDQKASSSEINGFEATVNFNYTQGKDQLKYGFQVNGFKTNLEFYNAANRRIAQDNFTTELGGYVRYNKVFNRLIIDPSFRLQYYASLGEMSPEPRLGLKYVLTDRIRLKAAGGFYSQNLMSSQSDRDVVNLFYGFLSGPDELPSTFDGQEVTSHLQKSNDIVGGFEADVAKHTNFQVEGYLKNFTQLTNINRNKLFDNNPENFDKPELQREDFIVETSKAYGVDFLLTYDHKPYYIWVTYSLAKVTRYDGIETYYPVWDRRHTVNVLVSYAFGKEMSWEASLRWAYGSAFPFTKTKGFYELIDFQQGVNQDYTTTNGNLGILYADYNNGRLSDFHRLDASLKKHYKLPKDRSLNLVFSVTNVYDRDNVFYFDRVNYKRVNQLPILPSVGLNYSF